MIAETAAFTHLHVHSHYSLLAGTASVAELAAQAAADGLSHLALTDSSALYGAVAFDRACRQTGIKPIIGLTIPTAIPDAGRFPPGEPPGLLVLLADGPDGYRSLCRLSSLIQGSPEREMLAARGLAWETLKEHTDGLICLSGGRQGWIARLLRAGDARAAGRYVARLGGIFADAAYLSLEIHRPKDAALAGEISALAGRFGLPTVAVQPVYCLAPAEKERLRLLSAIDHNCSLAEVAALPFWRQLAQAPADLHWLSPAEVAARFEQFPEAVAQSGQIAARCQPALPDGRPIWPALKLPAGQTADQTLRSQAEAGLLKRYKPGQQAEARERLAQELAAITDNGYAPLFLIVADIVHYARQQEIPVSTRGSVANSLVAYCTGITTVDPIAHDLLFERFLNPARANPPDIDLDFCSRRRDEVLAYVRSTYGEDQVALVATVSTMQPKSAVRETGKAYGLSEADIKKLAGKLPRQWHPDPRRRDRRTMVDLLADLTGDSLREVIAAAAELVGQPHHLSIHPGGLVITPGPLTDYVPVQMAPKGFLTTQFDHRDVERLGLPKLDLLGIRALTVLADGAELIRRHHAPAFRLAEIDLNDEQTGRLLSRGAAIGVFQCESAGAQRTLRQLKAKNIADLAVANAFFKPGPATGGMARAFVRRYRGEEAVDFLHPALAPILAATQGVLLFQEQVLRVATEIAGLSWAQADHLRRGMSKFKAQEMAALQSQFVAGCCRPAPGGPAFSEKAAQTLWEQVLAFAGYGFNRGHATAYADVSYRSAYLKAHWPAPFLCARLADWGGFHHPAVYMAEARRLGIAVRPPHINESGRKFSYAPGENGRADTLWMGLGQVRDLRRQAVRAIVAARQERPFSDVRDLAGRVALQPKELRHLCQCGALDGLAESRAALLAEVEEIRQAGSARQMSLAFARPAVEPETAAQRLAWEQHLLGHPLTVTPLTLAAGRLPPTVPLGRLAERGSQRITVAGFRLPGWTGGPGFFLSDGADFIVARSPKGRREKSPKPWQVVVINGRYQHDDWGGGWLQIETMADYD